MPARARISVSLYRYGERAADVRLRTVVDRHMLAVVRNSDVPAVFFRESQDRSAGDDVLPARGLGVDAERGADALHGMAAGSGISEPSLGYLLGVAGAVSAGDWIADASYSGDDMERSAAAGGAVWRTGLHQRRGTDLYSSIRACVVRFSQHC